VERAAKTAGNRLKGINLGHVEYSHNLRNKLYHAGNGITVQGDHAEQYSQVALELLDRLLGIPLKISLDKEAARAKRTDWLEHTGRSDQSVIESSDSRIGAGCKARD
jgi:hypothetical protein